MTTMIAGVPDDAAKAVLPAEQAATKDGLRVAIAELETRLTRTLWLQAGVIIGALSFIRRRYRHADQGAVAVAPRCCRLNEWRRRGSIPAVRYGEREHEDTGSELASAVLFAALSGTRAIAVFTVRGVWRDIRRQARS